MSEIDRGLHAVGMHKAQVVLADSGKCCRTGHQDCRQTPGGSVMHRQDIEHTENLVRGATGAAAIECKCCQAGHSRICT